MIPQDRIDQLGLAPVLDVSTHRDADAYVVSLFGDLDLSTAVSLDRAVWRFTQRPGAPLVLDLSGLAFMDIAGLRAVVAAHQRVSAVPRDMSLLRGRPSVHRLFELTWLDERLPFSD